MYLMVGVQVVSLDSQAGAQAGRTAKTRKREEHCTKRRHPAASLARYLAS